MITEIKKSYILAVEIDEWLSATHAEGAEQRVAIKPQGIQLNGGSNAILLVAAQAEDVWAACSELKGDSRWLKSGYSRCKYLLGLTPSVKGEVPTGRTRTNTTHERIEGAAPDAPKAVKLNSRKAYEKLAAAILDMNNALNADGIEVSDMNDLAALNAAITAVETANVAAAKREAEKLAAEKAAKAAAAKVEKERNRDAEKLAKLQAEMAALMSKMGK